MLKNKILLFAAFICTTAFYSCSKDGLTAGDKDYKTLGTSPRDLLTSSVYTTLKIEIQYMPGYAPEDSAIANLESFLGTYLNKPGGIQVTKKQIAASGSASLTLDQIVSIEKRNRTEFTGGNTVAVHILILDADYNLPDVLGVSYWNTSICIFGKLANANAGGAGQASRRIYYSTLFEHEFGHLMGLVNLGSNMQQDHKDLTNGYHCTNTNCLMYYGIENNNLSGLIINNIPSLDPNCIADLKANGGK